jgi:signal transduction histidine kinase
VRIHLALPDDALRQALSDLLADAGHECVGEASGPADLVIRAESGGPAPRPGTPTLSLRPGVGRSASADPAQALARALRDGGEAVWSSPLDAPGLVAALERGSARRATAGAGTESAGYPLLEASPDPWVAIDPATSRIVWANHAARARAGLGTAEEGGLPPGAAEALVTPEGRRTLEVGGIPVCGVWWTDARGRRVYGLVVLPRTPRAPDAGNLRTLAEIGRVSATLAHEIRNPLASLASAIDLLDGDLPAPERDEVARMAKARLVQMKAMLDDTLRLARPFRGAPASVDLAGVVASATALARANPGFEGIDLVVDVPEDAPTGTGYPEPLQQALLNALLNAAEAQGPHGRIHVSLSRDGERAVLRVRDEGPGLPGDRRERAFEPFYTTKTSGTGLGLAYVRRVADACGGRALFEDVAQGACLRIEVPLTPDAR